MRVDLGRDEFLQGAAGFVVIAGEEHGRYLSLVIPGRAQREPGIHFTIRFAARWIPGSRGACHRARMRATRWRAPE
jgi:hypothetical protein